MLKLVKFLFLLSLSLVASVSAQEGPLCGQTQIFQFIFGLPSQCSTPLQQVIPFLGNTDLNTDEGRQMVAQVCAPGCVGTIVDYLRNTCLDPIQAFDYVLWCYQTSNANVGPFCRYALSDVFDGQIFSNISSECFQGEEVVCPMGCSNALRTLSSELGCCYQTFYNNTEYLGSVFARGFINQMQLDSLTALGNPDGNPWTVCEEIPPSFCTVNPAIDASTTTTQAAPNTDGGSSNGEGAFGSSKSIVFIISALVTVVTLHMAYV